MQPAKALFLLGVGLVGIGLTWALALLVEHWLAQQPHTRVTMEPGWVFRTAPIELTAGESGRVGVALTVASRYQARQFSPRGDGGLVDLYRVPIHYQVLDSLGKPILSQWVVLDAARDRLLRLERLPKSTLETQRLQARFDPFPVPSDGVVRVEMRVDPDDTYLAEVTGTELRVFRHRPSPAASLPVALLTGAAGLLSLIAALIVEAGAGVRRLRSVARASVAG